MKHTPGPWSLHTMPNEHGWEIRAPLKSDSSSALGIVNVYPLLRAGGCSESEANARLIAAAPEMYDMLRDLAEDLEDGHWSTTKAEIRDLLTKIQGES